MLGIVVMARKIPPSASNNHSKSGLCKNTWDWPPQKTEDWFLRHSHVFQLKKNHLVRSFLQEIEGKILLGLDEAALKRNLGLKYDQNNNSNRFLDKLKELLVDSCPFSFEDWAHEDVKKWATFYFFAKPGQQAISYFFSQGKIDGKQLLGLTAKELESTRMGSSLGPVQKDAVLKAVDYLRTLNTYFTIVPERVLDWDSNEVLAFLRVNGYITDEVARKFRDANIDGKTLVHLEKQEFLRLGVAKGPPLRDLVLAIKEMISPSSSPDPHLAQPASASSSLPLSPSMSVQGVVQWIGSLGKEYTQYQAALLAHGVDGKVLMVLEKTDMEELGIYSSVHQKVILSKIQEQQQESIMSPQLPEDASANKEEAIEDLKDTGTNPEVLLLYKVLKALGGAILSFSYAAFRKRMGLAGHIFLFTVAVCVCCLIFYRNQEQICKDHSMICEVFSSPFRALQDLHNSSRTGSNNNHDHCIGVVSCEM